MTEVKLILTNKADWYQSLWTDYKTGQVLMLAYMNELSYQLTLETKQMHYWSRSRNELWHKGAISGHFQHVKSIKTDCDQDTCLSLWNKKEQPAIQEPTAVSLRIYMMTIKTDRSSYVRNTL